MFSEKRNLNIIIIGDIKVGKSNFVSRHKYGEFIEKYYPTEGMRKKDLCLSTNVGDIKLTFHECREWEDSPVDDVNADGVIVMFDVTNKNSFKSAKKLLKRNTRYSTDSIVLCGNKVDEKKRKVKPKKIAKLIDKAGCKYYDLSVKSNYNFFKPLNYLLRQSFEREIIVSEKISYIRYMMNVRRREEVIDLVFCGITKQQEQVGVEHFFPCTPPEEPLEPFQLFWQKHRARCMEKTPKMEEEMREWWDEYCDRGEEFVHNSSSSYRLRYKKLKEWYEKSKTTNLETAQKRRDFLLDFNVWYINQMDNKELDRVWNLYQMVGSIGNIDSSSNVVIKTSGFVFATNGTLIMF